MGTTNPGTFLDHLTRQMAAGALADQSDRQLVETALAGRDEAVFRAIVLRHGAMVYRVCRRVLRHDQDAEDAFQATFLVLAGKLGSVRKHASLASWLHGVARRVALQARDRDSTRRRHEHAAAIPEALSPDGVPRGEAREALDAELGRLPEKWRLPVILCYLEGRTQAEAAGLMGWSKTTLRTRLDEARAALGRCLARRGIAWSAALPAVLLSDRVASAVPPPGLVSSTARAAARVAAGRAGGDAVSAGAAALTEGMVRPVFLTKLKMAAAFALAVGLTLAGFGQFPDRPAAARQPDGKKAVGPPGPKTTGGPETPPTWQVRTTLDGHEDRVHAVGYSPDGKLLATASADGTVRIWNLATGKSPVVLGGHEGGAYCLAFSPDGKRVATAGYDDRTARVWEVATGRELQRVTHNDPVRTVRFTPDGKTLIAGGGVHRDGGESRPELRRWDAATGKELPAFTGGPGMGIQDLALGNDGKLLVTATGNTFTAWEWDGKGKLTERFSDRAEESGFVYGMALSPDDKTLAITWDAKVYLYDVATGNRRATLEKSHVGCWGPLAYSPDGKTVAGSIVMQDEEGGWTVQRRTLLRTWDAATGKVRETSMVPGSIAAMAFSPDGRTLAVGCRGVLKFPENLNMIEEEKAGPVKLLERKSGVAGK